MVLQFLTLLGISFHIKVPLSLRESLHISFIFLNSSTFFCASGLMLCLSQYKQALDLCWSRKVIYLMDVFKD